MPITSGGSPTLSPGRTFSRLALIELVNRRTKKVGAHLDMGAEFLLALQEFCGAHPFFWRRNTIQLATEPGVATYDLSDIIPVGGPSVQRILKVKILDPSTGKLAKLPPLFGLDSQEDAMMDTSEAFPTMYFVAPGTNQVIYLYQIPDQAYTWRVSFLGVPVMLPEQQPDQIPMVPGYMHWILALALEKNVLRVSLGEDSPQYETAQNAYDKALADAALNLEFAEEDHSDEPGSAWGYGDHTVRSVGGIPVIRRNTLPNS